MIWLTSATISSTMLTVTYCRTLKLRHITFHRQQRCELHIERLYRGDGAKQLKLAKTHTVSISRRGVILSPSDNILNWWQQNMSLNCIGTFQTRLKIKMYESRIILRCINMLSSKAEFGQWPNFYSICNVDIAKYAHWEVRILFGHCLKKNTQNVLWVNRNTQLSK